MVRPVHRRPDEIVEPGVDHHEPVPRALGVAHRLLEILHPADQQAGRRHRVASRLDLDADGPPSRRRQPLGRLHQHRAVPTEVVGRRVRSIRVGDATAQVHRLDVAEVRQDGREQVDELAHVLVELANGRPGADVRVQRHDAELGVGGARAQRRQLIVPDAVLRRGPARVARLHVPVAEPRVHAGGDGALVAGAAQLVEHPRRSHVGQHAVLQHRRQRVVAQHVGGEHHHRRLVPHREPGAARTQHLVAADRVDPQPGAAQGLQHLPPRVRLHRVAGLQRRPLGQGGQPRQPEVQLGGVVEVERRPDLIGDPFQGIGRRVQRGHARRNLARPVAPRYPRRPARAWRPLAGLVGQQRAPGSLHSEVSDKRLRRVALEGAAARRARRRAVEAWGAQVLAALDLELVAQPIGAAQPGRRLQAAPRVLGRAAAAAPQQKVAAQAFELVPEAGGHQPGADADRTRLLDAAGDRFSDEIRGVGHG